MHGAGARLILRPASALSTRYAGRALFIRSLLCRLLLLFPGFERPILFPLFNFERCAGIYQGRRGSSLTRSTGMSSTMPRAPTYSRATDAHRIVTQVSCIGPCEQRAHAHPRTGRDATDHRRAWCSRQESRADLDLALEIPTLGHASASWDEALRRGGRACASSARLQMGLGGAR